MTPWIAQLYGMGWQDNSVFCSLCARFLNSLVFHRQGAASMSTSSPSLGFGWGPIGQYWLEDVYLSRCLLMTSRRVIATTPANSKINFLIMAAAD